MARNLVTGGGGFVGRSLIRALLARGDEVVCLDHFVQNSPQNMVFPDLELIDGDVRDRSAIEQAVQETDRVIHLAATFATRTLAESRSINVEGTRNVAEAAAALEKPPVFVFISTLAAAGPSDRAAIESGPCAPVSHYGQTKLEAELVLQGLADRLPITIVRPPCVFGTGDRNLLALYKTVRKGWDFVISMDDQYSYLHVADLVAGLLMAVDRGRRLKSGDDPERQGLYYLTDPQPVTFPQLADMIAKSIHRSRVRHVRIPRPVCWLIGAIGEAMLRGLGRKTFLNLDKIREGLGGSWVCDGTRAREELGFAPAANLESRIDETTRHYESVHWL